MSLVTAAAHKTFGRGFSNERKFVKLTWDFANDGGATTNTYKLGTTDGKILVVGATAHVETACTSGGSATMKVGINGTDDDCFLTASSGAVASLVDDFAKQETAGQGIVFPSGSYVEAVIGTAAMTAGKVNVILEYVNID